MIGVVVLVFVRMFAEVVEVCLGIEALCHTAKLSLLEGFAEPISFGLMSFKEVEGCFDDGADGGIAA